MFVLCQDTIPWLERNILDIADAPGWLQQSTGYATPHLLIYGQLILTLKDEENIQI